MTGLSDMEELLARIKNRDFVDYMREAVVCYHGGAYRACIVLSYIALFDDLRAKLAELGRLNGKAREVWREIEKRSNEQKTFETYMSDQLKTEKLIAEADHARLKQITECRNKAAHPSGMHASAEEARFVFFEVIDKFLSKDVLRTTQAVDVLMERLKNTYFFASTEIQEVKAIVSDVIEGMHELVFPVLVDRTIVGASDTDPTLSKNAARFLVGLAALRKDNLKSLLRTKLIQAKIDDAAHAKLIVQVISADASIVEALDKASVLRLRTVLDAQVEVAKSSLAVTQLSHPVTFFGAMLNSIDEGVVLRDYSALTDKVLNKYGYTSTLLKKVQTSPKVLEKLIKRYKEDAGSSTFDAANNFARKVPDLDGSLAELIQGKDAFELLVNVCDAAANGAFVAQDLRNAKFAPLPELKAVANAWRKTNSKAAGKIVAAKKIAANASAFADEYL